MKPCSCFYSRFAPISVERGRLGEQEAEDAATTLGASPKDTWGGLRRGCMNGQLGGGRPSVDKGQRLGSVKRQFEMMLP